VVGTAALLLLGACSGTSKPNAEPTGDPSTSGARASTPTTAAKVQCRTRPGTQKARIRFVNLYTNPTYPKSDIDVWQGTGGSDPCARKLATVPFGAASDYIDVTASEESGKWSATAFVAGSTDKEHEIVSQSETWVGGEQAMVVFRGAAPRDGAPAAAGADEAFLEKTAEGTAAAVFPEPGQAALAIVGSALRYVVNDGEWVAGAVGKPGCLKALSDTDINTTHISTTQLLRYTVDPGSLKLALYPIDPDDCVGAPATDPVTIDATPGSSTFVFAYGSDAQHLALLALRIG
jgi:hypothetical protein